MKTDLSIYNNDAFDPGAGILKRIMWYWVNAVNAIGEDPNEVIAENVRKLEARYPGGKFDAFYSENRKDGDL